MHRDKLEKGPEKTPKLEFEVNLALPLTTQVIEATDKKTGKESGFRISHYENIIIDITQGTRAIARTNQEINVKELVQLIPSGYVFEPLDTLIRRTIGRENNPYRRLVIIPVEGARDKNHEDFQKVRVYVSVEK
ncbi:hypothetical protein HYW76_02990 [Candidatus Pacearchaeota archaeon]|nr:hypothetical protein [Candidatus Pacearchaeota archaeon]